ncbi:MAG: DUF6482 family protein [Pseudomonas sp.]
MQLQELLNRAAEIEHLELISIEGGIYLLDILIGGKPHHLRDKHNKIWHFRSSEHARDLLQYLPDVPLFLVHASAYDEMCGLSEGRREPLRVPISLRSQW